MSDKDPFLFNCLVFVGLCALGWAVLVGLALLLVWAVAA